jgi:hypothetical protein
VDDLDPGERILGIDVRERQPEEARRDGAGGDVGEATGRGIDAELAAVGLRRLPEAIGVVGAEALLVDRHQRQHVLAVGHARVHRLGKELLIPGDVGGGDPLRLLTARRRGAQCECDQHRQRR